jgi:hypothetical protein
MVKSNDLNDDELLALRRDGNHIAFTKIYNRYWRRFIIAMNQIINRAIAEDIVQDLLILYPILYVNYSRVAIDANHPVYING